MPRLPNISDFDNLRSADGAFKCRNCDKPVAKGRQHYCSEECMLEFNRNHTWEFVRKDVLKRDRYKCSICGKRCRKSQLDIDHIVPINMGGKPYDKMNLRTLCRECHKDKTKLDRWALK